MARAGRRDCNTNNTTRPEPKWTERTGSCEAGRDGTRFIDSANVVVACRDRQTPTDSNVRRRSTLCRSTEDTAFTRARPRGPVPATSTGAVAGESWCRSHGPPPATSPAAVRGRVFEGAGARTSPPLHEESVPSWPPLDESFYPNVIPRNTLYYLMFGMRSSRAPDAHECGAGPADSVAG